jgi:hypothetical protein
MCHVLGFYVVERLICVGQHELYMSVVYSMSDLQSCDCKLYGSGLVNYSDLPTIHRSYN